MSDEHRFLQDLVDADRGLLRTAAGLAQSGRTLEAIALLESELARTRSMQERPADMALLAKTAGIFSEAAGLTSQAADYYEEAFAAAARSNHAHRLGGRTLAVGSSSPCAVVA